MAVSMMSRAEMAIQAIASAIFDESIKYEVPVHRVVGEVKRALDNKMACVKATHPNTAQEMIEAMRVVNGTSGPVNCRHSVVAELGQWTVNLAPTKIIYSGNRTIVFWNDSTKTIVKCAKDQEFDEYSGFVAAYAKKVFGSTSRVKKLIKTVSVHPDAKNTDEAETQPTSV